MRSYWLSLHFNTASETEKLLEFRGVAIRVAIPPVYFLLPSFGKTLALSQKNPSS